MNAMSARKPVTSMASRGGGPIAWEDKGQISALTCSNSIHPDFSNNFLDL